VKQKQWRAAAAITDKNLRPVSAEPVFHQIGCHLSQRIAADSVAIPGPMAGNASFTMTAMVSAA
jgi:hypothetical protein